MASRYLSSFIGDSESSTAVPADGDALPPSKKGKLPPIEDLTAFSFGLPMTEKCNWTNKHNWDNLMTNNDVNSTAIQKKGGWMPFQENLLTSLKTMHGRQTKMWWPGTYFDTEKGEVTCDDLTDPNQEGCWKDARILDDSTNKLGCTLKNHCIHGVYLNGHPSHPYTCPSWVVNPMNDVPCKEPADTGGWDACPVKYTLEGTNAPGGTHAFNDFLQQYDGKVECTNARTTYCKDPTLSVEMALKNKPWVDKEKKLTNLLRDTLKDSKLKLPKQTFPGHTALNGLYFHTKLNKWFACSQGFRCNQIHVDNIYTGPFAAKFCKTTGEDSGSCVHVMGEGKDKDGTVNQRGTYYHVAKEDIHVISPYETDKVTQTYPGINHVKDGGKLVGAELEKVKEEKFKDLMAPGKAGPAGPALK